jgi:N6-adenosine-specific RNA methylase IME4
MTWEGLNPPYATIVADPPWMYQKDPGAKNEGQGPVSQAESCYSTLTNEQISALPVKDLVADAGHLYLWFTNPGMFGGRFSDVTPKDIAETWGFEFKTILTWVKPGGGGMGWFFRGQTEHVLFATRGGKDAAIPANIREPNVIDSRKAGHSQKPGAFFDLVERVSPGPYVELFARQPRLGWDHWGLGIEGVA